MKRSYALPIAEQLKEALSPHCIKCEIAGSIRRKNPEVNDIELCLIPKPYDIGLFATGVAIIIDHFPAVKGQLPCKYTRRVICAGVECDFFFATEQNWGLIYAIRTGSADFSHHVLAAGWSARGYKSSGGILHNCFGSPVSIPEEQDLFNLIGLPFIPPEKRSYTP